MNKKKELLNTLQETHFCAVTYFQSCRIGLELRLTGHAQVVTT